MDTVSHVDGEQTTKSPNVSDVSKAMLQARPVTILKMVDMIIKGGTNGSWDMY